MTGDGRIRVLVLGASSQIGHFLLPSLAERGWRVTAASRTPDRRGSSASIDWCGSRPEDLRSAAGEAPFDALIHLAPLPGLPARLPELARLGVKRAIALSTTGRFYKTDSNDAMEQAYIRSVVAAEEAFARSCDEQGIGWTLFRPTLVYGSGMDKNIVRIAAIVRRFGFFPVFGGGRGLRQPVHAADLAEACIDALGSDATRGKAYNLSGGGTLTYRDMVAAVFRHMGRTPRLLPVPLTLFRGAIVLAKFLPRWRDLSTEMATRQATDMCFDHSDATRDFGYRPRAFRLDDTALPPGG